MTAESLTAEPTTNTAALIGRSVLFLGEVGRVTWAKHATNTPWRGIALELVRESGRRVPMGADYGEQIVFAATANLVSIPSAR